MLLFFIIIENVSCVSIRLMTLTEGFLVVAIIILVLLMCKRQRDLGQSTRSWSCIDNTGTFASVDVKQPVAAPGPEAKMQSENMEYFANCQDPAEAKQAMGCMCDSSDLTYAINEFGGPGMEYKDWVTSQSVDPQVIQNHASFVKDRIGDNSQNVTGRTYALGQLESDQITWQGIRGRPVAVDTCNPTQMPDVNYDWYAPKSRFNWTS